MKTFSSSSLPVLHSLLAFYPSSLPVLQQQHYRGTGEYAEEAGERWGEAGATIPLVDLVSNLASVRHRFRGFASLFR